MSGSTGETVAPESSSFLRSSGDCSESVSAFLSLLATASGSCAGAISANQILMSRPLSFGVSASAGMSRVMGERLASVVPKAISLPLRICGSALEMAKMP